MGGGGGGGGGGGKDSCALVERLKGNIGSGV